MAVTEAATYTIATEDRACENCGSVDSELLWRYDHDARTRHRIFRFHVTNVICPRCGFVYVSPVHTPAGLSEYYGDAYSSFEGQVPDYDTDKRLKFIDRVAAGRQLMVEIGSNQQGEFHNMSRSMFTRVETVEINDSVSSDHRSTRGLEQGSADLVAHYFVLEHVSRVKSFLNECAQLLRPNGVMIVEVPDIGLYPTDPVALGNFEHTSHFSPGILHELAMQCGFAALVTDHTSCSRPFGFVAAYEKAPSPVARKRMPSQYEENKRLFLQGVDTLCRLRASVSEKWPLVQRYEAAGKDMVFWGANEMLERFLQGREIGSRVRIIDSDPLKAGYARLPVCTPDSTEAYIRSSSAIFIFTKLHARVILDDLRNRFSKVYGSDDVHIIDYDADAC